MKTSEPILNPAPPRLVPTIVKGFDMVASHVHLILLPILLDLFLWLGPKLRIDQLLAPLWQVVSENMLKIASPDMLDTIMSVTILYTQMLEQVNLLSAIRTIPVGLPSLIARIGVLASPLQTPWEFQLSSYRIGIAIIGALILSGFFLGTIYFNSLARFSQEEPGKLNWSILAAQYAQVLILFLILIALLIVFSIPLMLVTSALSLISSSLAQILVILVIFMGLWLVMPLVFSAHGIFVLDQKVVPSMLFSLRLVRFFLPGTSLFILITIMVSEGLNKIWTLPGTGSWLMGLGIAGHAFIVTALLAASFLYYRDGIKWMQFNIQRMNDSKQEDGGNQVEHQ
ncbi:MAG: hypothetical protein KBD67_07810 [Anaerolineaceae bacterium]|nr:hypothetical protein [Anaerolineaceae bacterium]